MACGNKTTIPPVVGFVGRSNMGKTTFVEKLTGILTARGRRVGVIKHAPGGFQIDPPGKDSRRYVDAGALTVILSAPDQLALFRRGGPDRLDAHLTYFHGHDIVIVEGYKRGNRPKIEVFRKNVGKTTIYKPDETDFIALITDADIATDLPRFDLEAFEAVADFIEERFLCKPTI